MERTMLDINHDHQNAYCHQEDERRPSQNLLDQKTKTQPNHNQFEAIKD